jgi:hypothetical protein
VVAETQGDVTQTQNDQTMMTAFWRQMSRQTPAIFYAFREEFHTISAQCKNGVFPPAVFLQVSSLSVGA